MQNEVQARIEQFKKTHAEDLLFVERLREEDPVEYVRQMKLGKAMLEMGKILTSSQSDKIDH